MNTFYNTETQHHTFLIIQSKVHSPWWVLYM